MDKYLTLAADVVRQRWPQALGAAAGGSILRGQGKPNSDIDMIVLLPPLTRAERWWLRQDGVPFDVFCHDAQTLRRFVQDGWEERRPVLLHILAEAHLLHKPCRPLQAWQRYARAVLRHGPPPLDEPDRLRRRYGLMTMLEDYADATTNTEHMAMAVQLHAGLQETICLLAGQWLGHGKWSGRLAHRADPALAAALDKALQHDVAYGVPHRQLLDIGQGLLARLGGPLQDPVSTPAPETRRQDKLRLVQQTATAPWR